MRIPLLHRFNRCVSLFVCGLLFVVCCSKPTKPLKRIEPFQLLEHIELIEPLTSAVYSAIISFTTLITSSRLGLEK